MAQQQKTPTQIQKLKKSNKNNNTKPKIETNAQKLGRQHGYLYNVGRSVVYASMEKLKEMNPVVSSFSETNNDIFKVIYKNAVDYRTTYKRSVDFVKATKFYEAAEVGLTALKEDIKTGNLYNIERESKLQEKAMDMGDDDYTMGLDMGDFEGTDVNFDDWGDDFSDFDDGDFNWDDEESSDEETSQSAVETLATIESIEGSSKANANAISSAVVRSAEYTAEVDIRNTNLLYTHNVQAFGKMNGHLDALNANMGSLLQYMDKNLSNHLSNSTEFFDQTSKALQDQVSLLREIAENTRKIEAKQEEEKKKQITYDSIVDASGTPDLEEYFKRVKKNASSFINEATGGTLNLMMNGVGEDSNMLAMFAANPYGALVKGAIDRLTPKDIEKGIRDVNESLGGLFGSMITKLNTMANDEDSPISRAIGKVFGIRNTMKSDINTAKYNKDKVDWDGKAHKALTEIIPGLLSKQLSAMTGTQEVVFNYDTGKFVTYGELKNSFDRMMEGFEKNAASEPMSYMRQMVKDNLAFNSKQEHDEFLEKIEKLYRNSYKKGEIINFNSRNFKEKYSDIADEDTLMAIQALGRELPRKVMLQYNNALQEEIARQTKRLEEEEKKGTYNPLFNGNDPDEYVDEIYDKKKRKWVKNKNKKKTQFNTNLLLDTKDNFGRNIFNYLQNIYKELNYMRRFSIGSVGGDFGFFEPIQNYTIFDSNGNPISYTVDNSYSKISGSIISDTRSESEKITDYDREQQEKERAEKKFLEDQKKRIKDKGEDLININELEEGYIRDNIRDRIKANRFKKEVLEAEPKKETELDKIKEELNLKVNKSGKVGKFFEKVQENYKSPTDIITKKLEKVDTHLYELIYGKEDAEERNVKGIIDHMMFEMHKTFNHFREFMDEKILNPIKEKLGIDKEKGLIKGLIEYFGLDEKAKNFKDHMKEIFGTVKDNVVEVLKGVGEDVFGVVKGIFSPLGSFFSSSNKNFFDKKKKEGENEEDEDDDDDSSNTQQKQRSIEEIKRAYEEDRYKNSTDSREKAQIGGEQFKRALDNKLKGRSTRLSIEDTQAKIKKLDEETEHLEYIRENQKYIGEINRFKESKKEIEKQNEEQTKEIQELNKQLQNVFYQMKYNSENGLSKDDINKYYEIKEKIKFKKNLIKENNERLEELDEINVEYDDYKNALKEQKGIDIDKITEDYNNKRREIYYNNLDNQDLYIGMERFIENNTEFTGTDQFKNLSLEEQRRFTENMYKTQEEQEIVKKLKELEEKKAKYEKLNGRKFAESKHIFETKTIKDKDGNEKQIKVAKDKRYNFNIILKNIQKEKEELENKLEVIQNTLQVQGFSAKKIGEINKELKDIENEIINTNSDYDDQKVLEMLYQTNPKAKKLKEKRELYKDNVAEKDIRDRFGIDLQYDKTAKEKLMQSFMDIFKSTYTNEDDEEVETYDLSEEEKNIQLIFSNAIDQLFKTKDSNIKEEFENITLSDIFGTKDSALAEVKEKLAKKKEQKERLLAKGKYKEKGKYDKSSPIDKQISALERLVQTTEDNYDKLFSFINETWTEIDENGTINNVDRSRFPDRENEQVEITSAFDRIKEEKNKEEKDHEKLSEKERPWSDNLFYGERGSEFFTNSKFMKESMESQVDITKRIDNTLSDILNELKGAYNSSGSEEIIRPNNSFITSFPSNNLFGDPLRNIQASNEQQVMKNMINGLKNTIVRNVDSYFGEMGIRAFDKGGYVDSDQLAIVGKGEYVIDNDKYTELVQQVRNSILATSENKYQNKLHDQARVLYQNMASIMGAENVDPNIIMGMLKKSGDAGKAFNELKTEDQQKEFLEVAEIVKHALDQRNAGVINSSGKFTDTGTEGGFVDVFDETFKVYKRTITKTLNSLLGEDPKKEKYKSLDTMEKILEESKIYAPDMITGALLGGGASLLTGFVGGPLLGAGVGAAIALTKNSQTIQDILFGKQKYDKDGNVIEREGGIVPKDIVNKVSQAAPDLKKFGITGALAGLLPIFPFGPIPGLLLGSGVAFAKNNATVQEKLFGEGGLIDKDAGEDFMKKKLPSILAGAGLGAVASFLPFTGPFGIVGSAMIGSALGFASTTDKFQTLVFGKYNEDTKEYEGGIVPYVKKKVFEPIVDKAKSALDTFLDWAKRDILDPLVEAFKPITRQIQIMFDTVFGGIAKKIVGFFEKTLVVPIREYVGAFLKRVFQPVQNLGKRLMRTVGRSISFIPRAIGVAGRAAKRRQIKKGTANYMTAQERMDYMNEQEDLDFFYNEAKQEKDNSYYSVINEMSSRFGDKKSLELQALLSLGAHKKAEKVIRNSFGDVKDKESIAIMNNMLQNIQQHKDLNGGRIFPNTYGEKKILADKAKQKHMEQYQNFLAANPDQKIDFDDFMLMTRGEDYSKYKKGYQYDNVDKFIASASNEQIDQLVTQWNALGVTDKEYKKKKLDTGDEIVKILENGGLELSGKERKEIIKGLNLGGDQNSLLYLTKLMDQKGVKEANYENYNKVREMMQEFQIMEKMRQNKDVSKADFDKKMVEVFGDEAAKRIFGDTITASNVFTRILDEKKNRKKQGIFLSEKDVRDNDEEQKQVKEVINSITLMNNNLVEKEDEVIKILKEIRDGRDSIVNKKHQRLNREYLDSKVYRNEQSYDPIQEKRLQLLNKLDIESLEDAPGYLKFMSLSDLEDYVATQVDVLGAKYIGKRIEAKKAGYENIPEFMKNMSPEQMEKYKSAKDIFTEAIKVQQTKHDQNKQTSSSELNNRLKEVLDKLNNPDSFVTNFKDGFKEGFEEGYHKKQKSSQNVGKGEGDENENTTNAVVKIKEIQSSKENDVQEESDVKTSLDAEGNEVIMKKDSKTGDFKADMTDSSTRKSVATAKRVREKQEAFYDSFLSLFKRNDKEEEEEKKSGGWLSKLLGALGIGKSLLGKAKGLLGGILGKGALGSLFTRGVFGVLGKGALAIGGLMYLPEIIDLFKNHIGPAISENWDTTIKPWLTNEALPKIKDGLTLLVQELPGLLAGTIKFIASELIPSILRGIGWSDQTGDGEFTTTDAALVGGNTAMRYVARSGAKYADSVKKTVGKSLADKSMSEVGEFVTKSGTKEGAKEIVEGGVKSSVEATSKFGFKNVAKGLFDFATHPLKTTAKEGAKLGKFGLDGLGKSVGNLFLKADGSVLRNSSDKFITGEVVSNIADNSMVNQIVKSIGDKLTKILTNEKVVNLLGKAKNVPVAKILLDNFVTKFLKEVAARASKAGGQALARIVGGIGTGGLVNIGFAVYDFISGFNDARNILGITSDHVPFTQRIAAAILKTLQGFSIVGTLIPTSWIMKLLINVLSAAGLDMSGIQEQQESAKQEVEEYNQKNGTDYTIEEYNKEVKGHKGIFGKVASGAKWVGSKVVDIGSSIGEAFKTIKDKTIELFNTYVSPVFSWIGNFFNGIKEKFNYIIDGIGNLGKSIMEKIDWFRNLSPSKLIKTGAEKVKSLFGFDKENNTSLNTRVNSVNTINGISYGHGEGANTRKKNNLAKVANKYTQKAINADHKSMIKDEMQENASESAKRKALETGVKVVKNRDLIKRIVGKIKEILFYVAENKSIDGLLGKTSTGESVLKKVFDTFVPEVADYITRRLNESSTDVIESLAKKFITKNIIGFAFLATTFINGYQNAESILGIIDDATFKEKIIAGIVEVFKDMSILSIVPTETLISFIFDALEAAEIDTGSIGRRRKYATKTVNEYNKTNKTSYSIAEYNQEVLGRKTIFEKIGDGINHLLGFDREKSLNNRVSSVNTVNGISYGHGDIVNGNPYFSQKEATGGLSKMISDSGCGPTATAMALSKVTGQTISPESIASDALKNGSWDSEGARGSMFKTQASKYGVQTIDAGGDFEKFDKLVSAGIPTAVSGTYGKGDSPYTSAGHIVTVFGKDSNGNYLVNDPRGEKYSKAYTKEELMNGFRNSWSFGKGEDDVKTTDSVHSTRDVLANAKSLKSVDNIGGRLYNKSTTAMDMVNTSVKSTGLIESAAKVLQEIFTKIFTNETVIELLGTASGSQYTSASTILLTFVPQLIKKLKQNCESNDNINKYLRVIIEKANIGNLSFLVTDFINGFNNPSQNLGKFDTYTMGMKVSSGIMSIINNRFVVDKILPANDWIKLLENYIMPIFGESESDIKSIKTQAEKVIKAYTINASSTAAQKNAIQSIAQSGTVNTGGNIFKSVGNFLSNAAGGLVSKAKSALTSAGKTIGNIGDALGNAMSSLLSFIGFGKGEYVGRGKPLERTSTSKINSTPQLNNFPYYSQYSDYSNKPSLSESGCGPTSAAMVLSKITGKNILPNEVADESYKAGLYDINGSNSALFPYLGNKYGINVETVTDFNKVKEYAKQGIPMVISGKGGKLYGTDSDGHIVATFGKNKNGYVVNDPSNPMNGVYQENSLRNGFKEAWVFGDKGFIEDLKQSEYREELNNQFFTGMKLSTKQLNDHFIVNPILYPNDVISKGSTQSYNSDQYTDEVANRHKGKLISNNFSLTCYGKWKGSSGKTSSGTIAVAGRTIAVDIKNYSNPSSPMYEGKKVVIVFPDGKAGVYIVEDIARKSNNKWSIDIYTNSKEEAQKLIGGTSCRGISVYEYSEGKGEKELYGTGESVNWGYFCDPSKGGITSYFDEMRQYSSGRKKHAAIDYNVHFQPLYAPKSGVVQNAYKSDSYGNTIVVKTNSGDMYYRLAHMDSLAVKTGDKVSQGQYMGKSGDTGHSYGAHLHFEVLKGGTSKNVNGVDPLDYYDETSNKKVKLKGSELSFTDYMKGIGKDIVEINSDGTVSDTTSDTTNTASDFFGDMATAAVNFSKKLFGFEIEEPVTTTTSTSGDLPVVGSNVAEKIFNYSKAKGCTEQAAAGIIGNAYRESSLDPTVVGSSANNFGKGQSYGLWQWMDGDSLKAYAKAKGTTWDNADLQIQYLWSHLDDPNNYNVYLFDKRHGRKDSNGKIVKLSGVQAFKQLTSPETAATWFEDCYEISADTTKKREQFARQWYEKLKTTGKGEEDLDNVLYGTGDQVKLGSKIIEYALSFLNKGFYYSQANRDYINNHKNASDCSSFTNHVYNRTAGVNIGENTHLQYTKDGGQNISMKDLAPSDVILFKNTYNSGYKDGVSHAAIYIGDDRYVHSTSNKRGSGIQVADLGSTWSKNHFLTGKRYLDPTKMVDSKIDNPNKLTNFTTAKGSYEIPQLSSVGSLDGSSTSSTTTNTASDFFSDMAKAAINFSKKLFGFETEEISSSTTSSASSSSGLSVSDSVFDKAVHMGDSITYSLGATKVIPEDRIVATVGHTAKQGQSNVPKVVQKKPPMVIMNYGTNDGGYINSWSESRLKEWFKEEYGKLIDKVKEGLPDAKIVLNQIWDANKSTFQKGIKILQPLMGEIASKHGATLVDNRSINSEKDYHTSDGIHFAMPFQKLWVDSLRNKLVSSGTGDGNLTINSISKDIDKYFEETLNGVKSSDFGLRDDEFHTGVDYAAEEDTPIMSPIDGKVVENINDEKYGFGNTLVIRDKKGTNHRFAHMKDQSRYGLGSKIKRNDVIGNVGSTGRSTGSHLHYEVSDKKGVSLNPNAMGGTKNSLEKVTLSFPDSNQKINANLNLGKGENTSTLDEKTLFRLINIIASVLNKISDNTENIEKIVELLTEIQELSSNGKNNKSTTKTVNKNSSDTEKTKTQKLFSALQKGLNSNDFDITNTQAILDVLEKLATE